ncbi:MAG: thiolase family protein [Deltaproteobacteria bacterium]|nr:thiolase family protein [Deltaproteobacteria bacterium]
MHKVKIIGGAMTKFGRHADRNLKSLVAEAVNSALEDAGLTKGEIGCVWVGNASQGVISGQESVRGQVVMRAMGIGGIPVFNVENACASSATAFYGAKNVVASGECEVALAIGMEKMFSTDRSKALAAFEGCTDVELLPQLIADFDAKEEKIRKNRESSGETDVEKSGQRSIFMDIYATWARQHMEKYGTTQRQLAYIASKNHWHSSMNPLAQYQKEFSVEEVLGSPEVSYPLTRLMCSPIGDGAAALIVCSDEFARKRGITNSADVAACVVGSGEDPEVEEKQGSTLSRLAQKAYEIAEIGPEDVSLAEIHDATSYGELSAIENLGLCPIGEGGPFSEKGHTKLGGTIPVNVSGGLESQGHPIGATGVRQIYELYAHLSGDPRVKQRQVEGALVGLAQNGGGMVNSTEGAIVLTILKR